MVPRSHNRGAKDSSGAVTYIILAGSMIAVAFTVLLKALAP